MHWWCFSIVEKSTLPKALQFNTRHSALLTIRQAPLQHGTAIVVTGHLDHVPCFARVFGVLRGFPLVIYIPKESIYIYITFIVAMEESYMSYNIYQTFC